MVAHSAEATTSTDLKQVISRLVQPGGMFEIASATDCGRPVRIWKNGPQSLSDIFRATKAFEDREFLVLADQRVTYGAFRRASAALAQRLVADGVGRGDVVAIMMPNRPEWLAAYFAIARAGAVSALINPAASLAELEHSLALSCPRAVICNADSFARLGPSLAARSGILSILVADDLSGADMSRAASLEGVIGSVGDWGELPPVADVPSISEPADPATILFTAGTTGHPKGVILSHRSCAYSVFHAGFRNARKAALAGEVPAPPGATQQVLLMVLPLFHSSGVCNGVLPLMMRGGRIVMMSLWSPKLAERLVEREGVNILGTVPMIAEQFASALIAAGRIGAIQQIICGGAPPPSRLPARVAEAGATPGQNWGMTETGGGVIGLIGSEFLQRPESCGLPAPIHDIRIVATDGHELPAGEVGELQVRGPQIMIGYLNDSGATAQSIVDGWLRTGDLAYLDGDGYCFIVDRAKDMLICAGENVYCIEIENALSSHPDVEEVAVVGIPHTLMGEQPAAVIKRRPGTGLTDQAARIHAAKQLQMFKTPNRIIVRDEPLPRNRLGKIQKADLRKLFDV